MHKMHPLLDANIDARLAALPLVSDLEGSHTAAQVVAVVAGGFFSCVSSLTIGGLQDRASAFSLLQQRCITSRTVLSPTAV
jgi:hypothetical protein